MTQSLITIGITYMVLALPLFVEMFVATITLKPIQRQLYVLLLASGSVHLIGGLLSIPYPSDWWYSILVVSTLTLYLFATRIMDKIARHPEN